MSETKFEDLTIQSNFMFKHVMGNKGLCQRFISNVVKCDVVDLEYIDTEKELEPYFDSKCVRLDVIVVDKNNNRYNLDKAWSELLGEDHYFVATLDNLANTIVNIVKNHATETISGAGIQTTEDGNEVTW